VFQPLLEPSRYKGAWGGRGSGKSHFYAEGIVERGLMERGHLAVCIREVQNTLAESSKRLIEQKLQVMRLGEPDGFKVFHDCIATPGDGIITFRGMKDSNAESIKSLEGYKTAWVEEAQTLSARSLQLLRPTIRAPGSELWFSWNARRKTDPVDMLLRGEALPTGAVVVQANWRDNPHFNSVLEQERLDCLRLEPDQYPHIWEGEYARVLVGAYYALSLVDARANRRIGRVAADPLLPILLFVDIGGTGANSDAFTIWAGQVVGREIRVLNYYEVQGQPLAAHLIWLRENKYLPNNSRIYLPHDGKQQDMVYDVSYESAFKGAGYAVEVIPNQGKGAALLRVASGRRLFSSCWFNEETTSPGLDALGWYHEKRDEARQIGLGPEHDWASHGADAFGLMCIVVEELFKRSQFSGQPIDYSRMDKTCG
jgi:phage terminase large subunit